MIKLDPNVQTVAVGASINLGLVIDGLGNNTAPSLGTFDVTANFDSLFFSLTGVTFGPSLGNPDPASNETAIISDISVAGLIGLFEVSLLEANAGNCIFCIPPYLEDLQTSSFTLATLTFKALTPGAAVFGLSINSVGDAFGNPLNVDSEGASVSILPSSIIPEPGEMSLFVLGLLSAGILGKRKREFRVSTPRRSSDRS